MNQVKLTCTKSCKDTCIVKQNVQMFKMSEIHYTSHSTDSIDTNCEYTRR
jgi:hypothetical protein